MSSRGVIRAGRPAPLPAPPQWQRFAAKGRPGSGKTRRLVALANRFVAEGRDVRFFNVELIEGVLRCKYQLDARVRIVHDVGANQVERIEVEGLDWNAELHECMECSVESGSPQLCERCLTARATAGTYWRGPIPETSARKES